MKMPLRAWRKLVRFTETLRVGPRLAALCYGRADERAQRHESYRAFEAFARGPQPKPDDPRDYYIRTMTRYATSNVDGIIEDCTAVLQTNPGVAYSLKGEYDRALDDFGRALQLNPGDGATLHNRGMAYYGKGDSRRAIRDFDNTLHLKPDMATPQTQVRGLSAGSEAHDE